jgi:membrane-associated protease RseP (regulator of RpoE activity)
MRQASNVMRRHMMKRLLAVMVIALPIFLFADEETVGYLGVSTQRLSDAMKIALDMEQGVLVEKVHEGSPAAEAGIQMGDIIFKIDKTEIIDYKSLKRVVQEKPNERVMVNLYRKGKKMSKTVTLAERERHKYEFEVDMPEIPDFKVILDTEELEASIENIKEELEQLKEELERLTLIGQRYTGLCSISLPLTPKQVIPHPYD